MAEPPASGAGPPALEARGLRRRFGARVVLDGVDLRVERACVYGFIGRNGAGKTTTIESLVGLARGVEGDVRVFGEPPRAARARIGYAPQDVSVYDDLTCAENVAFVARMYGRRDAAARAAAVLADVGLESEARTRAGLLSGGRRRTLNLALALAHDPPLVVLDEPTVGLDIEMRERTWEIARGLARRGTTVFFTTHYLEEAERLCDRVAILAHGRVVAEGTPRGLAAGLGFDSVLTVETLDAAGARAALAAHAAHVADVPRGVRAGVRGAPPLALAASWLAGVACSAIAVRPASLEDVYTARTGA